MGIPNSAKSDSFASMLELIKDHLSCKRLRRFSVPELLDNPLIKEWCGNSANPAKKINRLIAAHADETYNGKCRRYAPVCFSKISRTEWELRRKFKKKVSLHTKQTMSYSEWGKALMTHFFPKKQDKKNSQTILFLCDGGVLCEIWAKNASMDNSKTYQYIVADFVYSVVRQAGNQDFLHYFATHPHDKYFHLPFLCLQSLAWQFELPVLRKSSNYYERLRGIVNWALEVKGLPGNFSWDGNLKDDHDKLWKTLALSLAYRKCGRIVMPTATHDKHIAYSEVNSVFKSEDSKRLFFYFASHGIEKVSTMRDAKEIFYAIKKSSSDVNGFHGEFTSHIGTCIRAYFRFWHTKYYQRTFDPFADSNIKNHFFNILGRNAHNENTPITDETAQRYYKELQQNSSFLKIQDFRPGFIFYMDLARQSWKENSCRFYWATSEIKQHILQLAHGRTTLSDDELHQIYQQLALPYPWRSWMLDEIKAVLENKNSTALRCDASFKWQVLSGSHKIYPILSLFDIDDTFSLTQKGYKSLALSDKKNTVSLEELRDAGFNIREHMYLETSSMKWRKKIPSFIPSLHEAPHLYRVNYQDYESEINPGANLGTIESVVAVFNHHFFKSLLERNLPQLNGAEINPFLDNSKYFSAAILNLTASKLRWNNEIILQHIPAPYLFIPSIKIKSNNSGISFAYQGEVNIELKNSNDKVFWECNGKRSCPEYFNTLDYGLHKIIAVFPSGKKLKKDIFIIPQTLGACSCQLGEWQWIYDLEQQDTRFLEKQLLSATLTNSEKEINCLFEMSPDMFFWWNYDIGKSYDINTVLRYQSIQDYADRHHMLNIVPNTAHRIKILYGEHPVYDDKLHLVDLHKYLWNEILSNFNYLGKTLRVEMADKTIFTIDMIPASGDAFVSNSKDFDPAKDNNLYHWQVGTQELSALRNQDGCYIKGLWKNIEIYVSARTFNYWWLTKDDTLVSFGNPWEFETLRDYASYKLEFSSPSVNLTLRSNKGFSEDKIDNAVELNKVIQANMGILENTEVGIVWNYSQIIKIKQVFADYSFRISNHYCLAFSNVLKSKCLICQLDIKAVCSNELIVVPSDKEFVVLDDFFDFDGTQYFLAIEDCPEIACPQTTEQLLEYLRLHPQNVKAVFCYEQMTYFYESFHQIIIELEDSLEVSFDRKSMQERFYKISKSQLGEMSFFTEEMQFIDGICEENPFYSELPCRDYNIDYFLKNGFENWIEHIDFIKEHLHSLCDIRPTKWKPCSSWLDFYSKCIYAGQAYHIRSLGTLSFVDLSEIELPVKAQNVLKHLMDADKILSSSTKNSVAALFTAFMVLDEIPEEQEQRYLLGQFFYQLLFKYDLNYSQRTYIQSLFLTLPKYIARKKNESN